MGVAKFVTAVFVLGLFATAPLSMAVPDEPIANTASVATAQNWGAPIWPEPTLSMPSAETTPLDSTGPNVRPPCSSWDEFITFHVYGGAYSGWTSNAQIYFNGAYWSNNQGTTITCEAPYNIYTTGIHSPFAFYEWVTDDGSFQSYTSSSTLYYPDFSTSGRHANIALILMGPTTTNWGGYAEGDPGSAGFTWATTTFTLPSQVQYVTTRVVPFSPGMCYVPWPQAGNIVGYWVGIGGINGAHLFQAGVALYVYTGNQWYLFEWYAVLTSPTSGSTYYNCFPVQLHDQIEIHLYYSSSNTTSWGYMLDDTQFQSPWHFSQTYFTPDTTTSEWIAEVPSGCSGGACVVPWTDAVTFAASYASAGTLYGALMGVTASSQSGYQTLTPQYLTGPFTFNVNYGGPT